ncbi:unnamed protein product [Ectocarpus sp. 12 AP-2014]
MALRHVIRRGGGAMTSTAARQATRGGGGPPQPPFARNKPVDYQLDENHELIWDDGVAPETTIDFDAPHMSMSEAFAWWGGGLTFFAGMLGLVTLSDPESKREAVPRAATLPATAFDPRDLFKVEEVEAAGEDEEEEEDEEDE